MLDKIEGMVKGLFAGDGIVDELLTDKGVRMIIDRIPEDLIAWLAKIEQSEFLINAIAVTISKMLPAKHIERAKDVLRTAVASLDERVDDYRRHNDIDKPGNKPTEKPDDKTTPSTSAPAKPTPAQIMAEYRALIMNPNPAFLPFRKIRNDNLSEIYNRPTVSGDIYFGVDMKVFRAKVDEALSLLDENTFIDLLYDGPAEKESRIAYINAAVGELKAKEKEKTVAEIAADPNHPLNGVETLMQRLENFSLSFGR